MAQLWIYRALARLPLVGWRAKVLSAATLAVVLPTAALAAGAGAPVMVTALAGSALALFVAGQLLAPVRLATEAMEACAQDGTPVDLPSCYGDEAGRLMASAGAVAQRLDAVRHRLTLVHPVTGLPTREPFLAVLTDDMAHAVPDGRSTVLGVVRFADYDRLAAFDQAAADRALMAFAERLEGAVARDRPLAQIDRDCFAVWFRGVESPEAASGELQAIGYVLAQDLTQDQGDGAFKITPDVGMGAAVHPRDGDQPSVLLARAVAALPRSGQMVGAKPTFFSARSTEAARERFSLEQDLRHAIARDQFLLHYQPVVDLAAGRVAGAEALLRWRHPERGLVSPAAFVPILEDSGLMDEVGLWVLNAACRQSRAWEDQGLTDVRMAVNLSARQCQDPALKTLVQRTLERHQLEPESLELELTETAAMEDADHTRRLLGDLRAMGVSVAIDDFGAGYSSLSYLKNLPFSKLKIDREFVDHLDERRDSRAICMALIGLAEGLGITVLAEGVERLEEVETLHGLGCSMFQGYFFSRPLPAADFARQAQDPAWLALLASPVHRGRAALDRRMNAR